MLKTSKATASNPNNNLCFVCNKPFDDLKDKSVLSSGRDYAHNNTVYKDSNDKTVGSCFRVYYMRLELNSLTYENK
jgi:hypothetical protein